ncbi:hypothetical protein FB480_10564 [Agrobacterium vitis]|nr:hypothetical protein FB480_10564 [Agrobacterium vitis]
MQSIVKNHRHLAIAMGVVLLPIGAFATMGSGTQSAGPLSCDIRTSQSGGQITLNALASTDRSVNGNYTFHVSSTGASNGTNIDQSGAFSASPGKPATLGSVMLDASGATYKATLELTVDKKTVRCTKRIGDSA